MASSATPSVSSSSATPSSVTTSESAVKRDMPATNQAGQVSLSSRQIKPIPKSILQIYSENEDKAQVVQKAIGIATKIGTLAKATDANPILNLLPVMVIPASCRLKRRLGMAFTAAKTGQVSESIFYGLKAGDALGDVLGDASKTVYAIGQLAGFAQIAIMGVIFTVVLPKFFMVTSILGMSADFWGLIRVTNSYRDFCRRRNKNGDLTSLLSALEYLRDGPSIPASVTGKLRKEMESLGTAAHKERHFRGGEAYEAMKIQVDSLFQRRDSLIEGSKRLLGDVNKAAFDKASETIVTALNLEEEMDPNQMLSAIQSCHKEILSGVKDEALLSRIAENRNELVKLIRMANEIADDAESEMRRKILNGVIILLVDMLFLASSSIGLASNSQGSQKISDIIVISACVLHAGQIIFDNAVSKKRYQQLENFFKQETITQPLAIS